MGNEATNVGQIMPEFERRNPDIRVVVQAQPWTSAHQKLLTAYAGASLPDLSQVGNTWIGEMTAIGALSPVPPEAADLQTDQFDAVLGTMQIAGKAMATPWYVDTRLLFYRSDLLARAGYDAVPQTGPSGKVDARGQAGGRAGNYAILLPVNEFEQLQTFGLQGDDPLLRDGTRAAISPVRRSSRPWPSTRACSTRAWRRWRRRRRSPTSGPSSRRGYFSYLFSAARGPSGT
jgi:multiple sugar transport system substrate-binding protein